MLMKEAYFVRKEIDIVIFHTNNDEMCLVNP